MKTALILGANGQDGSYLAEVLLARGYDVIGVARQPASRFVVAPRFAYVGLDISDTAALDALLAAKSPDEIYVMAAIHGASGHVYEPSWQFALSVNVGAVHICLEHMRQRGPKTRLFYPSSLKAFGAHPPARISEDTPRVSDCLYSITKNAADDLIHYYRATHNLFASVAYYFNHDSPRRPDNFFLPRLAARIAAQVKGNAAAPELASLDFWCDWGSAREFAEFTADLLQADVPYDVILATGQPVYAGTLAADLAAAAGLPAAPVNVTTVPAFRADTTGLRRRLGRVPQLGAFDVAAWILRERYGITVGPARAVA